MQLGSPGVFGCQDEKFQLFQNSASLVLTCLKFRAERWLTLVNGSVVSNMAARAEVTPLRAEIRPGHAPSQSISQPMLLLTICHMGSCYGIRGC